MDSTYEIPIKIELMEGGQMPFRHHEGDACYDLYAKEFINVEGKDIVKIRFGIKMQMPKGYEAVIRPRSSSFSKKGLMIHIGTIDNQYRGELMCVVSLINPRNKYDDIMTYSIEKGEAIAQMKIQRVPTTKLIQVNDVNETERGDGGFGSTDN